MNRYSQGRPGGRPQKDRVSNSIGYRKAGAPRGHARPIRPIRPIRSRERGGRLQQSRSPRGTRQVGRGRGNQAHYVQEKATLGIISIGCFVGFWLMMLLVAGAIMDALMGNGGSLSSVGTIGVLAFVSLFAGFITGLIGVIVPGSNKIVAAIGLALNGLLVLRLLV